MAEAVQKAGRGQPRKFDTAEALRRTQTLFHRQSYEGVSLSDLTSAVGITPPGYYAAFQSKSAPLSMSLQCYSREDGIPVDDILNPDRHVAPSFPVLLEEAAILYGADADMRG